MTFARFGCHSRGPGVLNMAEQVLDNLVVGNVVDAIEHRTTDIAAVNAKIF